MPGISGEVIVAIALAVLVVVIARHLWKSHKGGGGCCGDCSQCGGCHGKSCNGGTRTGRSRPLET